jgi:hypothetical protein
MVSPLVLVAIFSLSQTVAAEPERSVAVIPANPSELGKRLEDHLRTALTVARVPLRAVTGLRENEAAQCETNRLCFALLGRVLETFAVARVEAADVGSDLAVLVEVIESASGRVLREESFVIPRASLDAELPRRLAPLGQKIFAALPPPRPIALTEMTLDPQPAENPALNLSAPPTPPRSSFPIWVTGTGAVVFAGTSAALLAVGASARNCLHGPPVDGRPTVCVPQSEVAGVQQRADVGLVTGAAAAAVAVGLTITAIVQHVIAN